MTPYKAYLICLRENKRKPELEPIILTNIEYSYWYAKDIIKERWPEAESIILKSQKYAYFVIKGRWTEAEPIIRKDKYTWNQYCQKFNIQPKGYHQKLIPKGVLGEFSKIKEEFLESEDAFEQNNSIMLLLELSDLIGAIEKFCVQNHKISLDDLIKMKNVTTKVFEEGYRK